jgi:hypothetical protein
MVPLLLAGSRRRSYPLAVLAGGLGIYAVTAIGYQHWVKPAVSHSVPQAAVQYFAVPAAAPSEPALPAAAFTGQASSEHKRFVSGVPAPAAATEQKPAAAEPQKISRRREPSARDHRSSREFAFRPFPFFRPFF